MRHRTLALKRETLTELTTAELSGVAAGSHLCAVTDACTHPSIDETCPPLPVYDCISKYMVFNTLDCGPTI